MLEFLYNYGLFLAKTITFVVAFGIVVALVVSAGQKSKNAHAGHLKVTKLNEHYDELKEELSFAVYDEAVLKQEAKDLKKKQKQEKKEQKSHLKEGKVDSKKRLYVVDFDGDIKASGVDNLREEITALLTLAREQDEIVVRLESAGGMVHSYGLAASQLTRIKAKGIPLTVCVDKVAASGGYMMACVANKVCAAPFAILGSIGVVAQLPNFHRLLKKNDVDFELLTAGEYKRTLTMFGENTDKSRKKFIEDLDKTHDLFKEFVSQQRPIVAIDEIATGETWFGLQAQEKQLVDTLLTSDDYITQQVESADIYHVEYKIKKTLPERIGLSAQSAIETTVNRLISKLNLSRFMS